MFVNQFIFFIRVFSVFIRFFIIYFEFSMTQFFFYFLLWFVFFVANISFKSNVQSIEKIINDYHFIALNFVILISYMQMKTQKMCEYQNINFNKNALVFLSSNYINWILIATFAQHICENCILTFFHNNRLCYLFCILSSLKFSCKFFQRDEFWNFLNEIIFSAM